MKTKTMRHAIQIRLFAVVLLATSAFASAANAQSISARFTLPFEAHWGKTVVPAGKYLISMDSATDVALVRSVDGKTSFFTPIPIRAFSHEGSPALLVMVRGNERRVLSLHMPDRGVSLLYRPHTNVERETLAKAENVQAVPITTSGK
jgi:hypothetical protein